MVDKADHEGHTHDLPCYSQGRPSYSRTKIEAFAYHVQVYRKPSARTYLGASCSSRDYSRRAQCAAEAYAEHPEVDRAVLMAIPRRCVSSRARLFDDSGALETAGLDRTLNETLANTESGTNQL
jgi:hypothetical protein